MELAAPILSIGGILLMPLIVGIIELLKRWGLPSDKAPLANGILTVGAFLLMQLVALRPEWESYVATGAMMVAVFLGAMGLYEWQVKDRLNKPLTEPIGRRTVHKD